MVSSTFLTKDTLSAFKIKLDISRNELSNSSFENMWCIYQDSIQSLSMEIKESLYMRKVTLLSLNNTYLLQYKAPLYEL